MPSLTKTDTRESHDTFKQYKVKLNLSPAEIKMIRYTWNRMLLDDEGAVTARPNRSTSPEPELPGTFPGEHQHQHELQPQQSRETQSTKVTNDAHSTNSSTAKLIQVKSSAIATSLFCRQFYANLLSKDSELEKMFPSIKHQAVSFAAVLSLAVMQLEDLSRLEEYLSKLGKRHTRILNIEPIHYTLMGEALVETFHERFGHQFTQELEIIWIKLYLYLANSILQFGIDPTMEYESYVSTPPSYNNSRRNSIIDDYNFNDDRKSVITENTSISTLSKHSDKDKSVPNRVPVQPVPSIWLARPNTPQTVSKAPTKSASLQAPNKKVVKSKLKRDCIIM